MKLKTRALIEHYMTASSDARKENCVRLLKRKHWLFSF